MKPDFDLKPGAVMQLDPEHASNQMFGGCMFVITETNPWGAQGYVQSLGENGERGGQAYYRAMWVEMEPTGGNAVWRVE